MNTALCILFAVFIAIAVRLAGALRLQLWQNMLCGTLPVLIIGAITLPAAWSAGLS